MKFSDFEYDGTVLSDLGYMICNFDSSSSDTVSNGSEITMNTISTQNGKTIYLSSNQYDSTLSDTIQICKNPCKTKDMRITSYEQRELTAWLNRKDFKKWRLLDSKFFDISTEATFNISYISIGSDVYGLELTPITNSPFTYQENSTYKFTIESVNGLKRIVDISELEGYIYPHVLLKIKQAGDLLIHNSIEDRDTIINNCVIDEVITMDYPVITTSIQSHKIQNDFNWNFFRIANTYGNNINDLTFSIPCEVEISYNPIARSGI